MVETREDDRRAAELDADAQALLDGPVEEGAPNLTHLSPEQARAVLGGPPARVVCVTAPLATDSEPGLNDS